MLRTQKELLMGGAMELHKYSTIEGGDVCRRIVRVEGKRFCMAVH